MVRVYAMRHGRSTWQEICPVSPYAMSNLQLPCTLCIESPERTRDMDDLLFDPSLSQLGVRQVRDAARNIADLGITSILVSPYRRAIQTGILLREAVPDASIFVDPMLRERISDPCDPGRPASTVAAEFPFLDFSAVPEHWWHDAEPDARGAIVETHEVCQSRADAVRASLALRLEPAVLLVSHVGFLRALTGDTLGNAQLVEVRTAV